jgi:mannose-6-phosphate isomerase-like protein (cupin superfamily)
VKWTALGPDETVYGQWANAQGVPRVLGHYLPRLHDLELAAWSRLGADGAIINHDESDSSNDCTVVELAPGGEVARQRHLFEETFHVLEGTGATTVWDADEVARTFEWGPGALFAIPLNAPFQLFNGSGGRRARLLSVSNRPAVMNMFANSDFVYDCDYRFRDRLGSGESYFDGSGEMSGRVWISNFVSDVRSFELLDYAERGAGGRNVKFKLAANTMWAHVSEFPVGTYKKAHRHGAGAHVVILGGSGYSLMWKEGEPIQRYDWHEGTLIIPPSRTFHQHFNTGDTPARYLALRYTAAAAYQGTKSPLSSVSTRLGGDQIEYEDESAEVRQMYHTELAKNGVLLQMDTVAGYR